MPDFTADGLEDVAATLVARVRGNTKGFKPARMARVFFRFGGAFSPSDNKGVMLSM